ncbi:hypothetical protein N7466_006301 [Penicillium verhagenii]|uniref:uncharacterized protein n=1 Tax=Penicillium verhagenii TaxID=1562060 RepID=UPI002545544E|nr:uncharacterized protein N7466_006301 [Penicillium verhagenii]KAJ5930808.1 hypothetical protein N7466_006301 [Penicillium verhagenii]
MQRDLQKRNRSRTSGDESGSLSRQDRWRKGLRGSSDDEGELTEDGYSDEDLRIGGPDLCYLPATTSTPYQECTA